MGIDNDKLANTQVPAYLPGTQPAFKPKAIYDSETPTSTAQQVTTTVSMDSTCGDPLQLERKMDKAQQLAHRMKPYEAAQTQNGDPVLPDFQAGEIEYD
jgi:hypothetical protein